MAESGIRTVRMTRLHRVGSRRPVRSLRIGLPVACPYGPDEGLLLRGPARGRRLHRVNGSCIRRAGQCCGPGQRAAAADRREPFGTRTEQATCGFSPA